MEGRKAILHEFQKLRKFKTVNLRCYADSKTGGEDAEYPWGATRPYFKAMIEYLKMMPISSGLKFHE